MNSNEKLAELMTAATTLAEQEYLGQLTILKLSTGWKVAFGSPNLDKKRIGRDQVRLVPEFETLEEALENLLETHLSLDDLYFYFRWQPLIDSQNRPSLGYLQIF